jgi:hypothetical protein
MNGFALGKEEGPQINFHGTKMVVRSLRMIPMEHIPKSK